MTEAAKTITVDGLEFSIDDSYTASWEMFETLRDLDSEDISAFEKLDKSFAIIERATGIDKDAIVEHVGGKNAPAADVIGFAVKIVQAITPKN